MSAASEIPAHGELLHAAQIIGDNKQHGLPIIQNGLSLCKIHHFAFDANLLGISPDYVVPINGCLMNEMDGSMPGMAFKRWSGNRLVGRFDEFRAAG
jgi:putative restriction endonuclease